MTSAPLGPRVRAGQRVSRPAWWPRLPAPRESVTLTPALAATTALASRPHAFSRYSEKPCKTARAISAAKERREVTAGNRGLQGPSRGSRPSLASCGDKAPLPCVSRAPAAPPETGVRASPQRPHQPGVWRLRQRRARPKPATRHPRAEERVAVGISRVFHQGPDFGSRVASEKSKPESRIFQKHLRVSGIQSLRCTGRGVTRGPRELDPRPAPAPRWAPLLCLEPPGCVAATRLSRPDLPPPFKDAPSPRSLGSRWGLRVHVPVLTCSHASLVCVTQSSVFTEKWGPSQIP